MEYCRVQLRRGDLGILFLLPLLILSRCLVEAVDLQVYTQGRCFGEGTLVPGALPSVCYDILVPGILSVNFEGAEFACETYIYVKPGCRAENNKGVGPGGRCLNLRDFSSAPTRGESIGSARFICPDSCPVGHLANANNQKNQVPASIADSKDKMEADYQVAEMGGVVFTDPSKGSWILKTPHVQELLTQLTNVPQDEKAKWLQALGASFQPAAEPSD